MPDTPVTSIFWPASIAHTSVFVVGTEGEHLRIVKLTPTQR